jgi:RNA polymerase sigma-70 factor (ECF subfamily)
MSTAAMPGPAAYNSEEFEGFFREHHLLVYRTACFITGSPNDAEDVLQTIFLRLLRRDIPPDLRKNPRGYLYKASVNASLDALRSRRREVLTSDFTAFPAIQGYVRSEESDVDDILIKRLLETLATLTPRTVQIVTLRYLHDFTERDIAKLLSISRGSVAVTLFRARMRLRKLLAASSSGEKI